MTIKRIRTHFARKGYTVVTCDGLVFVLDYKWYGRVGKVDGDVFQSYAHAHRYYFGY